MRKLTVLLSPSGSLLVEFPGSNGPRTIGLRVGFEGETLRRLLSHPEGAIDSPGSPTRSRALHTQYHRESPVETCPFCKEDGMIVRELESKWRNLGEGVQVRRLKPKSKKEDLMKMDLDF